MSSREASAGRDRISTGIPGLDTILRGGLLPASVFILQGPPGAGKTIMANQVAFHRAGQGESVVYVTLLAESHDRLLRNLGTLSFYRTEPELSRIAYVSGFDTLVREGLNGILQLLRAESRDRRASLLVVDGLFVLEETAQSDREFRKFVNDLEAMAGLIGCTVLLLTNNRAQAETKPEYTMVDGWIELDFDTVGFRAQRSMLVQKYRGSDFIGGRHAMAITGDGVSVWPRLEAVAGLTPPPWNAEEPVSSGSTGLDRLLGGGFPGASTTLLVGSSGVGKTTLGLQFLAQCKADAPGLWFGFYESPARLQAKARSLGLPLDELVASGAVEIVWNPPGDALLDQLGHTLLERIERIGAQRVVVDGLAGLRRAMHARQRLGPFLAALSNQLRRLQTTILYTSETPRLIGGESEVMLGELSAVAENIVVLRYQGLRNAIKRELAIVKVRDSRFEANVHEFEIGQGGVRIGDWVNRQQDAMAAPPFVGDAERGQG